jgi:predicted transcriptional regulator
MTDTTPRFEIWTADPDADYDPGQFAEDCADIEDAALAVTEWRAAGWAAWIRDKETGEDVDERKPR